MAEELEQILSGLELGQLKDLAQRYGIDCSNCESREEYIASILNSQKVKTEDLRSVLGTGPRMGTTFISDSLPGFAEAEQLLQETKNIFESGDYITTIDRATKAIDLGTKALSDFYGIGLSYAIRSSENMISTVKSAGIDATSLEQVLGQARQSFENKEYENTGSIIAQLKDVMNELYQQHTQKVSELIDTTQSLVDDAKELGSEVSEAEKKLQDARDFLAAESLPIALDSINESDSLARTAKQNRVQEISTIISKAGEVIEEAKYLNAPVSEAESLLEDARSAFDSEDYRLAIENADNATKIANEARDEQIQKAMSVQDKIKPAQAEAGEFEVPISTEEEEGAEAVEVKVREVVEPTPTEVDKVCPKCGGEPTYVEQYERNYCYNCSEYIEPVEKGMEEKAEVAEPEPTGIAKVCPKCGGEPTYVKQYERYYCYNCSEYIEPVEKGMEEKAEVAEPKPTEIATVCPKCGGEPTYVEQYQRYYCHTCSEYIEPVEKGKEEKPKAVAKPKLTVTAKLCPTCGQEPTYVEQYQKYYCYNCSGYVEPVTKTSQKNSSTTTCPTCGGSPAYMQQYKRYFCYTCNKYI